MKYTITNSGSKSKLILEVDGIELTEAINIVEAAKTGMGMSKLDKECLDYINAGQMLMAVKHYKDATGKGLKDSKDYCDALKEKHLLK